MNYYWLFYGACVFWVYMFGQSRKWMIQANEAKRKADEQYNNP